MLEAGTSLYQANYFSPSICAPVGTHVSVAVSNNEHNAATKLMTASDQTIDGLVYLPVGGGSTVLTTTEPCWTIRRRPVVKSTTET